MVRGVPSTTRYRRSDPAAQVHLALTYLAFISLGLPDGVLGIAWPSFRESYGLTQAQFGILLVGAGPGYFVSGLVVGRVLERLGFATTLVGSTALVALGLAAFASAPPWPLPILALATMGLGSGTIDAGINAFAAARFKAREVNWLHAAYSLGAAIGPAIMALAVATELGWRSGYAVLAVLLAALAIGFAATARRWSDTPLPDIVTPHAGARISPWRALQHTLVPIQTGIFFVYTGLEAMLGAWAFTVLHEGRGVSTGVAGFWVSAYFASILLGRIALGAMVERIGPDRLVRAGTVGALGGAVLFAAGPPAAAYIGLVLSGVSLAPIFPTLISRTADRLPPEVAIHAVGMKVAAAMIGAAALPILAGLLAQWPGLWAIGPLAVAAAALLIGLHESLIRRTRAVLHHA